MAEPERLPAAGQTPSREELLQRARDMVPVLRERAAQAEKDRRISDETQAAMVEAGFYRIFQPKAFGGFEMDYTTTVDIAAELGRGCGSSAWVFTNLAQHGIINGVKDRRAQEEMWGDNPDTLCASAHPGRDGKATPVDGGYVVDGVWHFSSGIDFADWVNLQLMLRPEDGPAEHRFAQVHKSDYEVIDDWFVSGMSATGSRSLRLKEVFIPDYRMISSLQLTGGPTPGSAVSDSLLYQLPFWPIAARLFSGPLIGIARGVQELTEEDIDTRVAVSGTNLREEPMVHQRLAESGAEISAAWALALQDCNTALRMTEAGEKPDLLERVSWWRNNAYVVVLCVRAIDRLYGLAGMRGMLPDSHVQRGWRDAHAAACQVGTAWDPNAAKYGRARFGLPIADPRA